VENRDITTLNGIPMRVYLDTMIPFKSGPRENRKISAGLVLTLGEEGSEEASSRVAPLTDSVDLG